MKSWLRFFGVSFFSDKIAKEAKKRGVMNCVLGLVLAVIFIYCGVLAANTVPFYTHYDNASEFKSLVYGLIDENQFTVDNGLLASDKIIDTFASQSDAEKYGQS